MKEEQFSFSVQGARCTASLLIILV
uniref:Uncharacterized protein n=1 Tax=Arundo donax TaxID=35708 RepID=A0A0A9F2X8_ARUDO